MRELTCKHCGESFRPKAITHYIAREAGQKGIVAVFGSYPEEKLYDAFDCPNCGTQIIVGDRMRKVEPEWKEQCTPDTETLPALPRRRPRSSSVVLSARSRHMKAEKSFLLTM